MFPLLLITLIASVRAEEVLKPPYGRYYQIGTGLDSRTGMTMSTCIEESEVTPSLDVKWGDFSTKFRAHSSASAAKEFLELGLQGSYGWGLFSVDADFSSKFASQTTGSSVLITYSTSSTGQPRGYRKYELTKPAQRALRKGLSKFVEMCGDRYVRSFLPGARLLYVAHIKEASTSRREEIAAEVNASGTFWSAALKATSASDYSSSSRSVEVDILGSGPKPVGLVEATSEADVKRILAEWEKKVEDSLQSTNPPGVVALQLAAYSSIADYHDVLSEAEDLRDHASLMLKRLTERAEEVSAAAEALRYAIKWPRYFDLNARRKIEDYKSQHTLDDLRLRKNDIDLMIATCRRYYRYSSLESFQAACTDVKVDGLPELPAPDGIFGVVEDFDVPAVARSLPARPKEEKAVKFPMKSQHPGVVVSIDRYGPWPESRIAGWRWSTQSWAAEWLGHFANQTVTISVPALLPGTYQTRLSLGLICSWDGHDGDALNIRLGDSLVVRSAPPGSPGSSTPPVNHGNAPDYCGGGGAYSTPILTADFVLPEFAVTDQEEAPSIVLTGENLTDEFWALDRLVIERKK